MSNPTVLLIDYEPASIEQMKGPLLAAGYHVEVVFDGIAGLKAFKELKPDLVLIEAMIPKKHGFEVCQEIKKTPEGKNTPVVIATSIYKGRKYRNQALKNYGCDEYLEKPVAGEDLMAVCRRYLKEVREQVAVVVEPADVLAVQPAGPRPAEQGLNNLDAMDEKEISDKLDEILGAFSEAVDDVKEPGAGNGSEPVQGAEPVTDQDMVMALLDEVGNFEPAEFVEPPLASFEPTPEPAPEPAPEPEPEPVLEAEAEVAAQVDEVFPEAAYEGRTAEEYLSGVTLQDSPSPAAASGTRLLGLGIPAWIGIAAAVAAAVIGGVMFLGGSDDAVTALPAGAEAGVVETSVPAVVQQALDPEDSGATAVVDGSDSAAPVEVQQPVSTEPLPEPRKLTPPPVISKAKPTPPATKKATPPAMEETKAAIQPRPEPPKPEPAKPETVVVQPAPAETAIAEKADMIPEPAPEQSREVLAPQEQVVRTAAPVAKPVVPERARRVLAKAGDLVPLNSVDSPPVQKVMVPARYHPVARKLGQQGTVHLSLLIDETGTVADVKVVEGIPNSTLNQMAEKAARQWLYEPAVKDQVPVKVWKQVSLDFRL